MPNMNGTGPRGLGQMTGRREGLCGSAQQRSFDRGQGFGRGRGPCGCGQQRGFGRGRGYGAQSAVALSGDEQKKVLEAQLNELENEKREIETKIKELN